MISSQLLWAVLWPHDKEMLWLCITWEWSLHRCNSHDKSLC